MNKFSETPLLEIQELVQKIKLEAEEKHEQEKPIESDVLDIPILEKEKTPPLPELFHRDDFFHYYGREFVRHAYLGVLLREPDPAGMDDNLKFLRKGGSRQALLANLVLSEEGQEKAIPIKGMEQLISRVKRVRKMGEANTKITKLAPLKQEIQTIQSQQPELRHRDDFLFYDGKDFIRHAYLGILLREPDEPGLVNNLKLLRSGVSREMILAKLMLSEEGKAKAVPIKGMSQIIARSKKLTEKGWINKKLTQLAYFQDRIFYPILTPILKIHRVVVQQAKLQQHIYHKIEANELQNNALLHDILEQQYELQKYTDQLQADNEKAIELLQTQLKVTQEQYSTIREQLKSEQQKQDFLLKQAKKGST